MCGGFTQASKPNESTVALANKHKADCEKKLGKHFTKWEATQGRTQVVAGVNHDVKIDTGAEFVHIRIYEPLPGQGESQVTFCKGGFTKDSPLQNS